MSNSYPFNPTQQIYHPNQQHLQPTNSTYHLQQQPYIQYPQSVYPQYVASAGYYVQQPPSNAVILPQWTPSVNDALVLDRWFDHLDSHHTGHIQGDAVVAFLLNSNLPRETLKDLWALSTTTGSLSRMQFYNLLRLISLALSPSYAGTLPTLQLYVETLVLEFALPNMILATSTHIPIAGCTTYTDQPTTFPSSSSILFEKNDQAFYMGSQLCTVVDKHLDDFPNVYYTIRLASGQEKQTVGEKLFKVAVAGPQSSGEQDDYYTEFISSPTAIIVLAAGEEGEMKGGTQQDDEDDFSDFASATIPMTAITTDLLGSPVVSVSTSEASLLIADPFDMSGELISFPSLTSDVLIESTILQPQVELSEEDDDFADFQGPAVPSPSTIFSPVSTIQVFEHTSAADFSVFDELVENTILETQVANEEWDEFECAVVTSEPDLLLLDEPFEFSSSLPVNGSLETLELSPLHSFDLAQAPPLSSVKFSTSSEDILSLFSSSSAPLNLPQQESTTSSFSPPLLSLLLPPLSEQQTDALAYFEASQQQQQEVHNSSPVFDDDFGDFEGASVSAVAGSRPTVVESERNPGVFEAFCLPALKATAAASRDSSAGCSSDDLLVLANVLSSMFYYEDALLCLRQHYLVSAINAGRFELSSQLSPRITEMKWQVLAADTYKIGVSTVEMAELLAMINEDAATFFMDELRNRNKTLLRVEKELSAFLSKNVKSTILSIFSDKQTRCPLLLHCLSQISLKRRLRCTIAVFTSHSEVSWGWVPLLQVCQKYVEEGQRVFKKFTELSSSEQELVVGDENFSDYLVATVRILELALSIVATAIEISSVRPDMESLLVVANRMLASADAFRLVLRQTIGLRPETHNLDTLLLRCKLEFMDLLASEDILRLISCMDHEESAAIIFCDLTLRPLYSSAENQELIAALRPNESDFNEKLNRLRRRIEVKEGRTYSKLATQMWEIIEGELLTFPKTDSSFHYM